MIDLNEKLIGPAERVLSAIRKLDKNKGLAVLVQGAPGIGKTHLLDQFALELTGSKFAIEGVNGQSLSVDLVRDWRNKAAYGNLFSQWTVKRIDEIDLASPAAQAELLTYIDYLRPNVAILASTNEYGKLRAQSKGRLETRFVCLRVDAPSITEASEHLASVYGLPLATCRQIALGAVPEGCLATEGVNMRACVKDAQTVVAADSVAIVESEVAA